MIPWSVLHGAARYLADQMTPAWEPVREPVIEELLRSEDEGITRLTYRSGGLSIYAYLEDHYPEEWEVNTASMGCRLRLRVFEDKPNHWKWEVITYYEETNRDT